nr:YaiO family outer membrane beta-barrel protein [Tunicatimonas sp. TK19036]
MFLTISVFSFCPRLAAQEINVDSLYTKAQTQAYARQFDASIANLRDLLANNPEHYDAHLLLCSVYSWKEDYDLARTAYQVLLSRYPTVEVYQGAVRVEVWDRAWESALSLVNQGLNNYSTDDPLKLLKAQILAHLNNTEEAIALLENDVTPSPQADSLLASINRLNAKHTVRIGYYHAYFDKVFTPWHLGSIEYQRRTNIGPIIGRVNMARMFDQTGRQVEIDAYPKLASRTYAYLNFGVSDHTVFPKVRWGAEIFQGFRSGLEISGGLRALYFEPPSVYVYTAQVAHHASSHWISARAFLTSLQTTRTAAGSFAYRQYLQNSDHYFTLYADYGNTPLQVVSLPEVMSIITRRAAVDYVHPFMNRMLLVRLLAEYRFETYQEQREINRWGFGIRLEKRF